MDSVQPRPTSSNLRSNLKPRRDGHPSNLSNLLRSRTYEAGTSHPLYTHKIRLDRLDRLDEASNGAVFSPSNLSSNLQQVGHLCSTGIPGAPRAAAVALGGANGAGSFSFGSSWGEPATGNSDPGFCLATRVLLGGCHG